MKSIFRRLIWLLMMTALLVSFVVLWTPGLVHAAATCTPKATLPADIPANGPLDTGAHVIATFNNARQQEGCNVSLSIDPTAYDAATPQIQELMLVNAERRDRGLGVLQLDTTLMSQIDLNHSREMVQYNYFAHPSPINQPGGNNGPFARLTVNPAINGHNDGLGENIAGGGPAADAIYRFMYEDSASNWGHRQNILGYSGGTPGHSTWIGIGIATGGKFGFYSTLDFLDDANSTKYTPPATADTQPPTMNPPTIVDANTVQVTNVHDDSDGNTTGAAGVTGVVFYVGSAVDPSGKFLTVVAKQAATAGTWTATLSATDLTMLHAVAVDGSGNYTDCAGNAASCAAAPPGPTVTEFPIPTAGSAPFGITSGSDRNLWFTESNTNQIGRITTTGVVTEFPIPTANSAPTGITSGPDGNLWFTESNTNQIGRITTTGVVTEFPIPTAGSFPLGITSGSDGNLWFTENSTNQIGRITTSGVVTEFPIPTANSFPFDITSGPDGNLWFAENNTNQIGRITTSGVVTEFPIPTANSAPTGITSGPDGNLWFAENSTNQIGRITTTGVVTEFPVRTAGSGPAFITSGSDGNLWFTENNTNQIGRITTH